MPTATPAKRRRSMLPSRAIQAMAQPRFAELCRRYPGPAAFVDAAPAQERDRDARMLGRRRVPLPVEVVQEPRERPTRALGRLDALRVRAHARRHALHVVAERGVRDPLVQDPSRFVERHRQMCPWRMCSSISWRPLSTGHEVA